MVIRRMKNGLRPQFCRLILDFAVALTAQHPVLARRFQVYTGNRP